MTALMFGSASSAELTADCTFVAQSGTAILVDLMWHFGQYLAISDRSAWSMITPSGTSLEVISKMSNGLLRLSSRATSTDRWIMAPFGTLVWAVTSGEVAVAAT